MSAGVCDTCGGEHAHCRCPREPITREQVQALRTQAYLAHADCPVVQEYADTIRVCDSWLAQDDALREAAAREAALLQHFTDCGDCADCAKETTGEWSDAAREIAEKARKYEETNEALAAARSEAGGRISALEARIASLRELGDAMADDADDYRDREAFEAWRKESGGA